MRTVRTEPLPQCEACGSQLRLKNGKCICTKRLENEKKLLKELTKKVTKKRQ